MIAPTPQQLCDETVFGSTICTLATASLDGKPEAATVHYVADNEYNLYFESFPDYRKYKNIRINPRASVVITDDRRTVQMDGEVQELSGNEAEKARQLLIERHGKGSGYLSAADVLFFRFRPNWIRVLVDGKYPPQYAVLKQ